MNLGERMLKNFAWILKMSGNYDFSQLSETNSSGVRVSVRVNSEFGQPTGLIVCAASSLCLPLSPLEVYNFLTNLEIRHQVYMYIVRLIRHVHILIFFFTCRYFHIVLVWVIN